MKKLLTGQLLISFLLLMTASTARSQDLAMNTSVKPISSSLTDNKKQGEPVYVNDVSSKVLRSFYRSYGEVPSAKWFKSANGFSVHFTSNGINRTVYYRINGDTECRILYYFEDQLSPAVRHLVKSNFYDFSIFHITEVQKSGTTAYFVKIQDRTSIKIVKVVDNEWEITETLDKH